ncbi:hypothetical protein acdb102_09740 [Acidothermaceae bacterium B102]|nr:hypothetical protein acdb102_09740 [Acidothermaceae bacterium B102]
MDSTGKPSLWWGQVAGQHADMLARFGYGEVKRHQALRYFTWQWRWRQILRSEQFRFLLRKTPPGSIGRVLLTRQPLSAGLWRGLPWGPADRWLYALATRLLWLYAEAHGDAEVLTLGEPSLGNPPPVLWRGEVISQDLANCSLEVAAMRRALDGRQPTSILEIGGGYGRTAYSLLGIFPDAAYTVVDLEPALSISRFYLTALYPHRDLTFVDAGDLESLTARPDLVVAIASLEEMTPEQVDTYLSLLSRVVRPDATAFVKQWREWHNPEDHLEVRLDDYLMPAAWTRVLHEASPVQTRFVQAAWRT